MHHRAGSQLTIVHYNEGQLTIMNNEDTEICPLLINEWLTQSQVRMKGKGLDSWNGEQTALTKLS